MFSVPGIKSNGKVCCCKGLIDCCQEALHHLGTYLPTCLNCVALSVPRFASEREAERAVLMLNGQRLENKNIIVTLF